MHTCHSVMRTGRGRWSRRGLWAAVLGGALALEARAGFPDIRWVGAATNYAFVSSGGTNKAVFWFTNGVCEIVPYAADTVRVRFDWQNHWWNKDDIAIAKPLPSWPAVQAVYTNTGTRVEIRLQDLVVEVDTTFPFRVHFKNTNNVYLLKGHRWEFDPVYNPITDLSYTGLSTVTQFPVDFRVKAIVEMPSNEAYFGLGEYAGSLNRRGLDLQGWNSDDYSWIESKNPLYKTFPFVYGVRPGAAGQAGPAYGLFFNNPSRPVFRMGTQSQYFTTNVWSFEAGEGQLDYFFFGGGREHSMRKVLQRYTELTGLPAMLPKWGFGYHLSRWSYDNQSWVEWLADTFKNGASNFPLDAIYLDIDYMDFGDTSDGYYRDNQCRQLQFNGNFPTPSNMIAYCLARGIRLVPIVEPWINRYDPNLFAEASNAYHFVKYNDGRAATVDFFFGQAAFLDFTSLQARDWWRTKLGAFLTNYPFAGIWNDLSEPADTDGNTPDLMGRDALYWMNGRFGSDNTNRLRQHITVKNTYCVWETSCTYDALLSRWPNRRPFVLTRAGWPGIQRYALNWSGDNKYTYDHLRCNIRLGNSVMISGQVNYGHDIGGFSGQGDAATDTTPELMTRWHQWGALNPFCRNHSAKWNMEREPFRFEDAYYRWMKDAVDFRYRLMPYLYSLAYGSSTDGVPMNAPVVFYFAGDTNTFGKNEYEIMVGEGLLAAPVYNEGDTTRSVYLPTGAVWYSWHDGSKSLGGQTVTVPAPMSRLPLFARQGAIIPMGPRMQYTDEFQPAAMDILVWPATNLTEFLLYEDDGVSFSYQTNHFAKTRFSSQAFTNAWHLNVAARSGSFNPYTNGTRALHVAAQDVPPVEAVLLDGSALTRHGNADSLKTQPAQGWAYDTFRRVLTVKLSDNGAAKEVQALYFANPQVPPASSFTSAYSNMSVTGTFNLWDPASRNMRLVANQTWAAVLSFSNVAAPQFKFTANDAWAANWGENNQSDTTVPIEGQTAEAAGNNITVSGTLNGLYTITFNESTRAYSVYAASARDSDGDGMTDQQEMDHGLNPYTSADADFDADGDGVNNLAEAVAGTSPADPAAYFSVTGANRGSASAYVFSWDRISGRYYDVYYATGLTPVVQWLAIPALTNLSGIGPQAVTDSVSGVDRRFYKVRVRKP